MRNVSYPSKQRGMALLISLVMLLLMSIIVVHAARSSNLEILLGNNSQDAAQALMSAEDSALAAELLIESTYPGAPTVDFGVITDDGLYAVGQVAVDTVDWTGLDAQRVGSGYEYREYIIEYLGPTSTTDGSIAVGAGMASDRRFLYRTSGRGQSSRGSARVVQTIYATAE